MKITLRKNRKSTSVVFKAETGNDGVQLKDALLQSVKGEGLTPAAIINALQVAGYREAVPAKVNTAGSTFFLEKP